MSDCRAGFSRAGFRSDPNGPNKTQTENLGDGKVIDLLHALQWWDGGGGMGHSGRYVLLKTVQW